MVRRHRRRARAAVADRDKEIGHGGGGAEGKWIRSAKSSKLDSRAGGSSILEISRGSKLDRNSMQEELQCRTPS